jgi:hypothetical protein
MSLLPAALVHNLNEKDMTAPHEVYAKLHSERGLFHM